MMSKEIKVTVVIPVYNTEHTLARTIDSVLAQTLTEYEIVIVDDGSPDKAGAIADDYADKYPSLIRVIHQENRGLAEARRAGAHIANGEYLMMLDSDDTIPPESLETLYAIGAKDNLDGVFGSYVRKFPEREFPVYQKKVGILTDDDWMEYLFTAAMFGGYSIIKKEFWGDYVYPENNVRYPSEDFIIFLKMNMHKVGLTDKLVYNYYYNSSSLSISGTFISIEKYKDFFKVVRGVLTERGEAERLEYLVRYLELEMLVFQIDVLNREDQWVKQVLQYDMSAAPRRYKMLLALLKMPDWLRHTCIKSNRLLKRLFGKA